MPLVEISLSNGGDSSRRSQIGAAIHDAIADALGVPYEDHFQIHDGQVALVFDPGYLGVDRSKDFMVIRIYLARGRSIDQKKALYRRIAELLGERCEVRPEDVFVTLIEVGKEDFSFGCGDAQYADETPSYLDGPGAELPREAA